MNLIHKYSILSFWCIIREAMYCSLGSGKEDFTACIWKLSMRSYSSVLKKFVIRLKKMCNYPRLGSSSTMQHTFNLQLEHTTFVSILICSYSLVTHRALMCSPGTYVICQQDVMSALFDDPHRHGIHLTGSFFASKTIYIL